MAVNLTDIYGHRHWVPRRVREALLLFAWSTYLIASAVVTFLTTRRNNLVSIYDASKGGDGLFHVQSSPRGIFFPSDFQSCLGETTISSPFEQDPDNIVHLRLSDQGGIVAQRLTSSAASEEFELRTGFSDEMKELERREVQLQADTGPLGLREYAEVNMAPVYESMSFRPGNQFSLMDHLLQSFSWSTTTPLRSSRALRLRLFTTSWTLSLLISNVERRLVTKL
jgi:hypothetical protein